MAVSTPCAIILAGGKSQRMGQDKALLVYDGKTFLEHLVTALRPVTNEILVVVDRDYRYALSCGRIVVDAFPDTGPVGGIVTGLMAAGPGIHYVVPCDMPAINPQIFELFGQAMIPPLDAAVPQIGGQSQPLCGAYRHTAAPKLMAYLESGQRTARGALSVLNVKRIDEVILRRIDPDIGHLQNINTPEEFEEFRQRATMKITGQD